MTRQQDWRKSSYSGSQENCVEVAMTTAQVGVRDSKHPAAGELSFPPATFTAFLRKVHLIGRGEQ
ncbi:DUF397 domain-containing protein [Saccharothrix coeruleofusca]|uniref:DUF397 domain-containing protein n=1 Tax=Saccharothrix coeruleofusca TaxID=33919 RepID=A0A918AQG8_9PSEU|nr:DUF397 domain-containing protein [Saccharothrix coeruleofusca]GGP73134.1 hypothetical protein GCM10010185_53250 [Saccharothrix coeruleofusca]